MFMRVDENKTESFEFLAQCIGIADLTNTDKQSVTTFRNDILCNQNRKHTKKLTLELFFTLLILLMLGTSESEFEM